MNKYQKVIFSKAIYTYACYVANAQKYNNNYCKNYKATDGQITLKQDEDITINNYIFISYAPFEYCIDGKWLFCLPKTECPNKFLAQRDIFFAMFSFDKPITKIRITDNLNLVDPLEIPVVCELADKKAYYAKIEESMRQDLIRKAQIKHAMGNDLVNIYFQPCQEDYSRTKIAFYRVDEGNKFLLSTYEVEKDAFFKSITGLTYGKYGYKVKQYSRSNTLIFETDYLIFDLSAPNYGDKPFIYWN